MAKKLVSVGMLAMALSFGLVLSGCRALIGAVKGDGKKAEAAAQTFVGKSVDDLLAIGSPKYVQTAGKIEKYAFPHWMVRKAAGEDIEKPAFTDGQLLVVFSCTGGKVTSFENHADQQSYFGTWTKM
jgi:hypothetical protein